MLVLFSRLKSKNLSDLQRGESNYNDQETTRKKFIKEFFESTQNSSLKNESELLIFLNKVLNDPKLRIAITSNTDCADTIKLICDYMLIRLQKNGYQLPPINTLKEKVFWSKQTCHMPYYLDHENIPLAQIGHLKKLLYRNPKYLQIAHVSKFASPPLNSDKLANHAYAYHHFNQNTTRVVGFVLIGESQQDTALTLKHFWKIIPT